VAGEDFERFRLPVLEEDHLERRLTALSDWAEFVDACIELASERGIALDAADVEQARISARRAWFERGLTA
jgi:hypothetical protein